MIEEMIDSIIQAEDRASEIIKASVNESNNIVNEAKKKAEEIVLRAKDDQLAKENAAIQSGENKVVELRTAQLEDARKYADTLDGESEKNKKKVTEIIIKELKEKYGVK